MLLLDIYQEPAKYLLDRGATVKAVITCSHYCHSSLFQGGLEILCSVTVIMPGTIPNHLLLDRYRELVTELFCEPKDEIIIGNFLSPTEHVPVERHKNDRKGFQFQKKERFSAKTSGFCLDVRKRTTRTKIKTKKQMRQLYLTKYTVYSIVWKKKYLNLIYSLYSLCRGILPL